MAPPKNEGFLIDGISALPGGVNSGILPQLLDKTQVAFATNCTFRGGYVRNRPGLRKIDLDFDTALVQQNFETKIWQGAAFFKSEYGSESIVVSIGGRVFDVKPVAGAESATVSDVSIPDDLNSSGNSIAWLWQSESWMIINDGQMLPIFYDGQTTRRSRGESQTVGTTNGDFVVPAIGESIDINLTDTYTGPYNSIVFIGDAFYQVNSSASGYQVTLKSLSAQTGTTIPANSQLIFPSNLIGQLTADSTSGAPFIPVSPGALPQPGTIALHITPLASAINPCPPVISAHVGGTEYLQGSVYICLGSIPAGASNIILDLGYSSPGGVTVKKYAPVYQGYVSGTSPLGMLTSASISTPAVGGSFNTFLRLPYNGPLPGTVVIGDELFEITASNNEPTPSNAINVTNINDTAAGTVVSGTLIKTVPELPVGRMGAYGLGRNWMSLPDGRSFIGSDIVGGSSGTPALNNRDAVLHTTENSYLFGGGAFVIPGNIGDIRSMTFTANLDASLGQGPLQVGTPTSIFSCQAPVDRTTWDSVTNPILTQSLIGKGPLGQYATLLINSDTFFRARDGIGSLVLARRDFTSWGNVPISREMQPVIDLDNPTLTPNATAVQFDNRLLMGCFPYQGPFGIFHQGIIALNFDPVSSLRGKAASIYDGLWTGLQAFQFVSGSFAGDERSFAFIYNSFTNRIELWELQQSGESEFDNDTQPLTWSFETASLFTNSKGHGEFDLLRLMDGELYVSEIEGPLYIETWWRPDYSTCWQPWISFGVCAADGPKQYRSRLGLGIPDQVTCDPTTNRPFCVGNNFQVRIQITGACKVMGLLLKARPEQETKFSVPNCKPLCEDGSIVPDSACEPCYEQGTCRTFPIVFYNLNANKTYTNELLSFPVVCPNGTTQTVYVAAGRISYTLPFPPDYAGPYPPLIMGCAAGGTIIRTIPEGSTQAEIDSIVDEMIKTCAQAIAESEVDCNAPVKSFKNEAVYFVHVCETGTLTYDETLPSWITLDAGNSQLIGAAGIFSAATQAAANSIAQAALDTFGNAALGDETLNCGPTCPDVNLIATLSTIGTLASYLITGTRSAATRKMMTAGVATQWVTDTSSNTISSTASGPSNNANRGCFATSTGTFYFQDASSNNLLAYDSSGNYLTSISICANNTCGIPVYSPAQDRIYVTYWGAANHIVTINPNTNTVVTDTNLGVLYGNVFLGYYSGGLVMSDLTTLRFFSLPLLLPVGTLVLGGQAQIFEYSSLFHLLFVVNPTNTNEMLAVSTNTFTTSFSNVLTSPIVAMAFNPSTFFMYAALNNIAGEIAGLNISEGGVCYYSAPVRMISVAIDYSSNDVYFTSWDGDGNIYAFQQV